ncbi:MAG: hypothetical protein M1823_008527, partial [Watsoniomyces obsoletus]
VYGHGATNRKSRKSSMNMAMRKIEVAQPTAERLQVRAEMEGLSITELLEQLLQDSPVPFTIPPDEAAELKRRWAAIEAGEPTIPHEEVVAWLQTWGTPNFKPWGEQ